MIHDRKLETTGDAPFTQPQIISPIVRETITMESQMKNSIINNVHAP